MNTEETPHGIWECKVGEAGVLHERGLDLPMRQAVRAAYREITGQEPDFIFSGWRAELTESERAAHEGRNIDPAKLTVSVTEQRLAALEKAATFLEALEQAGVDNWDGYYEAQQILRERDAE